MGNHEIMLRESIDRKDKGAQDRQHLEVKEIKRGCQQRPRWRNGMARVTKAKRRKHFQKEGVITHVKHCLKIK